MANCIVLPIWCVPQISATGSIFNVNSWIFLRIFVKKLPLEGVKWHPPPRKQVPSLGTMSTSNSTSVTKRRDDDTVFLAKFSPAIFMEGLNLRSCGKNRPSASVGFSTPKWSWKHLWPPFSQNYGGIMPILSKNLLQMLPMVLLSIIRGLKSTGGIH